MIDNIRGLRSGLTALFTALALAPGISLAAADNPYARPTRPQVVPPPAAAAQTPTVAKCYEMEAANKVFADAGLTPVATGILDERNERMFVYADSTRRNWQIMETRGSQICALTKGTDMTLHSFTGQVYQVSVRSELVQEGPEQGNGKRCAPWEKMRERINRSFGESVVIEGKRERDGKRVVFMASDENNRSWTYLTRGDTDAANTCVAASGNAFTFHPDIKLPGPRNDG